MITGRREFGVALIGKFIYAVAGMNKDSKVEKSSERFDLDANKWDRLPENTQFDEFGWSISLVVSSKRYITVFGG